jgi:hypothetical protein
MSRKDNRERTGPGIDLVMARSLLHGGNRGGRPRKDGSRADTRPTLADAGVSKRDGARMRAFARLTDAEFEHLLAAWSAEWRLTGRKPSIERFISKRGDNTRLERETDANLARLKSTLRRIERDHEYDASQTGEAMRLLVAMTQQTWREWFLSLSVNRSRPR